MLRFNRGLKFRRAASTATSVAVVLLMFVVSVVARASQDQKAEAFVLCKNKKDVRTIRILPDQQKQDNCMITYSKGSSEEVVGSNRSASSCKTILHSIQHTLETSHWSCRNVQSAMVTTGANVSRQ